MSTVYVVTPGSVTLEATPTIRICSACGFAPDMSVKGAFANSFPIVNRDGQALWLNFRDGRLSGMDRYGANDPTPVLAALRRAGVEMVSEHDTDHPAHAEVFGDSGDEPDELETLAAEAPGWEASRTEDGTLIVEKRDDESGQSVWVSVDSNRAWWVTYFSAESEVIPEDSSLKPSRDELRRILTAMASLNNWTTGELDSGLSDEPEYGSIDGLPPGWEGTLLALRARANFGDDSSESYLSLSSDGKWSVDCDEPPDDVTRQVLEALAASLGLDPTALTRREL